MKTTTSFSILLISCTLILLGFRIAALPAIDVSSLFTKDELEDIIGGPLKPLSESEDKSIVRYYPVNGTPYLEAVIIQVIESDAEAAYTSEKSIIQKTGSYKDELKEFGEKAYWADNGVTTDIHVLKGSKEITVSLSQSKAPLTKLEAAKKLMKMAIERMKD